MRARYKSLVDDMAAKIRNGTLTAGTQLPTHRALAIQAGISLATASRVYAELEIIGLVKGETGRGTFVREFPVSPGQHVDQHAVATDMLDLNFNYPALPEQAELLREAFRQLTSAGDIEPFLRYQPHAGRMQDRLSIADHLSGADFRPAADDVLIVNGAQHGLAMVALGLLSPGDVVAVDTLTYPGFKAVAGLAHLELLPIPPAGHGADLDVLESLCRLRRIRAIYTMPTLHNPMGWVTDLPHRLRLIALARRYDMLIIEDAAWSFLIENSPPPLAALAPERTVHVTGFSKNIAAGLRIGALVCPQPMREPLERAIRTTTWNTPSIITAITTTWLNDGTVKRLEALKRKDALLRQSMARQIFGEMTCLSHPASYFLWLPLSGEERADKILKYLIPEKISVSTAEPFSTGKYVPQALRIALGSVPVEKLEHALNRIKEAVLYQRDL
ncbi:PLP-dependent aminotransferase family protein [Klebsiella variicola]